MANRSELEALIGKHGLQTQVVRLSVLALDSTRTPCTQWAGPIDSVKAMELIEQIEERALRQANVLGGSHAFVVELAGQDGQLIATEFFRVSAEAMPNGAIATEPANEGGAFAQHMRHNEQLFRYALTSAQRMEATLGAIIDRVQKRNDALENRVVEQFEMVQRVVMGDREHELALLKAKSRNAALEAVAEKVGLLLPDVAGALIGKGASQPAAGAAIQLKSVLSTLREEQMQAILSALDPQQAMAMINAMKLLAAADEQAKKEAAAAAAKKGASNGTPSH